jgi:hypothetical protein
LGGELFGEEYSLLGLAEMKKTFWEAKYWQEIMALIFIYL